MRLILDYSIHRETFPPQEARRKLEDGKEEREVGKHKWLREKDEMQDGRGKMQEARNLFHVTRGEKHMEG